ncbi:MAG: hypothetical protein LBM26_05270, partial [Methanobrevibacter sp.]|nr:hypothetical protein [Methanobrevibacter sp.]
MADSNKSSNHKNFDDELKEDNNVIDEELLFSHKSNELLSKLSVKGIPISSLIILSMGIIFIILGFGLIFSASEKIADNVIFGESGVMAAFFLFLGILLLGIAILKILSKKAIFSDTLDKIKDLELLEEDAFNLEYNNEFYEGLDNNNLDNNNKNNKIDVKALHDEDFKITEMPIPDELNKEPEETDWELVDYEGKPPEEAGEVYESDWVLVEGDSDSSNESWIIVEDHEDSNNIKE